MTGFLLAASLYLGVSLTNETPVVEHYPSSDDIPGTASAARWKTDWLLLRRIEPPAGEVLLGNPAAPKGAADEVRAVRLTEPYYIGVYEFTAAQWQTVMGRPAMFGKRTAQRPQTDPRRPVRQVSYNQMRGSIREGIDWPKTGHAVAANSVLAVLRRKTGLSLDLPTEAQWEVACRAGTTGPWNDGGPRDSYRVDCKMRGVSTDCDHTLDRLGRCHGNGGDELSEVGSFRPNAWGLYDMHGNVNELCLDRYDKANNPAYAGTDPTGPEDERLLFRVIRGGGCWNYYFGSATACTSYARWLGDVCLPTTAHVAVGFRLVAPAL